jgi:type I restriction enzyme S subunit
MLCDKVYAMWFDPKAALGAYIATYLRSPSVLDVLEVMKTGTSENGLNLTQDKVLKISCLLPPLPEQRRIVKKLESLQARSRRAREALDAVPALLEKLRQSILAAAFRGDLTADWRAQHPDVEPASELLKRIRIERRKKWEQAELAKLKAKGKVPTDDKWKQKYVEPEPVDDSELPELPEGWCWASVDEVTSHIVDCLHRTPKYVASGYPAIRTSDLVPGRLLLEQARCVDEATYEEQVARLIPVHGDVFYSREGTIGIAACVPKGSKVCISQRMMHLRVAAGMTAEYFMWGLNSPVMYQQAVACTGGSVAQHINIGDIKNFAVPVAPEQEQVKIAKLVNCYCSGVEGHEQALLQMNSSVRLLDSAFLAKAFRGELVPQDPNDIIASSPDAPMANTVTAKAQPPKSGLGKSLRSRRV